MRDVYGSRQSVTFEKSFRNNVQNERLLLLRDKKYTLHFNSTNNPNIKNHRLILLNAVSWALKYESYKLSKRNPECVGGKREFMFQQKRQNDDPL